MPSLTANDDIVAVPFQTTEFIPIQNVLTNDTYEGLPVIPANVTIVQLTGAEEGIYIDPLGAVLITPKFFCAGHQITTSLLASVCNTTVAAMNTVIGITTLAPAAAYNGWRIKLTNGSQVQIIERNVPHFALNQFPTYTFATTYTVEIELKRNGVWLGYYGPACQITSPAVVSNGPVSQISPAQCGITLAQINTLIAMTSMAGVTGYRFRVSNLTDTTGPNAVQTIDRTQNWFRLPMLARYN